MKLFPLCIILTLVIGGCQKREDELAKKNATLQNTNSQLNQDIAARDEYIDKIVDSINDVYTSIENVQAKEKSLLKETTELESNKKLTRDQIRARLIERINMIRTTLSDDHKRLRDLQAGLAASRKQYAGLEKMVASLQKTIEERDQSIAELGKRVEGLEQEVHEKGLMLSQKDSIIGTQYRQITTAYYIAGTREQLEKMGIIKKEGGFLWGLLGSTTILASGFDDKYFKPLDKTSYTTITVDGKIIEIIPKRNPQFYQNTVFGSNQTALTIAQPDYFWQEKYLVIITDRPATN
jgi:uncharacterized protein YoxC